jgi:hypothetical protein
MRLILEKMTGRTFKVVSSEELSNREEGESPSSVPPPPPTTEGAAPARVGWGVEYERREVEYEAQVAQFSSAGVVETADGRTLNFNINLEMSRERLEVSEFRLFAGDARPQLVDPLVINFDGTAAELTEDTHSFDLDADGRAERIAFVRNGSGFLALDMNENGVIDNGTELFGPTTGDGFAELARHDEDGNGWIDEADAAYDKLRVWTQSEGGDKQLETLAAKNVGAIYLGQVATPFELRNDQNETQGVIQSTGIYLSEDGRAGTVQHVDLATTAQPREEGDAAATRTSAVADAPITQPPPPPETPLPE